MNHAPETLIMTDETPTLLSTAIFSLSVTVKNGDRTLFIYGEITSKTAQQMAKFTSLPKPHLLNQKQRLFILAAPLPRPLQSTRSP